MRKLKSLIKKIACERIIVLLEEAKKIFDKNEDLAKKYVERAWKIKTKYKIRMSRELKYSFCKKCFSPYLLGKNVIVRVFRREKCIAYICLNCKHSQKFCYKHGRVS